MADDILQELWSVKDKRGAKYRGDVRKFMADLRKSAGDSGRPSGSPRKSLKPQPHRKSASATPVQSHFSKPEVKG